MTQENKDLLLQDLCARLPYGVKCKYHHIQYIENGEIIDINRFGRVNIDGHIKDVCDIKPYLFPLSSMTEEQFVELKVFADLTYEGNTLELVEWNDNCKTLEFWLEEIPSYELIKVFDWLNKNHFDYRGLIEKGLAIDCTNLNVY